MTSCSALNIQKNLQVVMQVNIIIFKNNMAQKQARINIYFSHQIYLQIPLVTVVLSTKVHMSTVDSQARFIERTWGFSIMYNHADTSIFSLHTNQTDSLSLSHFLLTSSFAFYVHVVLMLLGSIPLVKLDGFCGMKEPVLIAIFCLMTLLLKRDTKQITSMFFSIISHGIFSKRLVYFYSRHHPPASHSDF